MSSRARTVLLLTSAGALFACIEQSADGIAPAEPAAVTVKFDFFRDIHCRE